ncbi:MAG: hypothetical protein FJZ01_00905 [Candidatus Sericytochromatia bacterium]|nr:hypothetical protein [Candidatus Tanganyikabacteria bacterium]
MPFPRRPQKAGQGTDKITASPTAPLQPEDLKAFGTDQFKASPGLRASAGTGRLPNRTAEQGRARIRELHEELARAKATVLEVRPRMAILKRAIRLNEGKLSEAVLFQNLPMQEKLFTRQVAARIAESRDAARAAAVASGQYESAWEALRYVEEALTECEMGPPEEAFDKLAGISVEKMRGQVFHLTSVHVHFENDPVLARLFPPPHLVRPRGTGTLDPRDVEGLKEAPPQPYTLADLFRPTVRRVTDMLRGSTDRGK